LQPKEIFAIAGRFPRTALPQFRYTTKIPQ
jgi:hypothetical protein